MYDPEASQIETSRYHDCHHTVTKIITYLTEDSKDVLQEGR
jgi:hypothetical protein